MFLDEHAVEIIARSMGLSDKEVDQFKENYFEVIANYMANAIVGYMAEHDPEKAKKIDAMFLSDKKEIKEKAHKTMIDQMKLYIASYEDLEEEIKSVLKEYDNETFFTFVGNGPKENVLELLQYLSGKIDRMANYQKALEMAKKRFSKNEVDEFFSPSGNIDIDTNTIKS